MPINKILRDRHGNAAVEFIFTAVLLILICAVLLSALVYITQYYSATYICRRVVRTIEIAGEYNRKDITDLIGSLHGGSLRDLTVSVDADYWSGSRIQLRDEFTVHLSAVHRVGILLLGEEPLTLDLPIKVSLSGRSEVFWKE